MIHWKMHPFYFPFFALSKTKCKAENQRRVGRCCPSLHTLYWGNTSINWIWVLSMCDISNSN